jgi:hypothetical protein
MRRRFPQGSSTNGWYRYRIVSVDMIYTGQREGHLVEVWTSFDPGQHLRSKVHSTVATDTQRPKHDQHYHAEHQSPPLISPRRLDHHDDTHVEMTHVTQRAMTWTRLWRYKSCTCRRSWKTDMDHSKVVISPTHRIDDDDESDDNNDDTFRRTDLTRWQPTQQYCSLVLNRLPFLRCSEVVHPKGSIHPIYWRNIKL